MFQLEIEFAKVYTNLYENELRASLLIISSMRSKVIPDRSFCAIATNLQ
ncbi:hypothetical protein NHE_0136 [Neorickettsia helminthoeca str. Oregon]|uniref:Uncharacterized protein n=1 Tax=Neorickettsia helminthoeca str. Oregon TaxID=1286528 RepID=X5HL69_9RICK|nr:hypothetical protein NHE_0136 [Neorickettsia helminthoeca str. Oregon]